MRILELFGGIGACTKALKRLGIETTTVDYVEIDKYAVASYNAINGTNFKPQDICEWDKDIEVDLIMHGSPCQDFSVAGLQAGGDENSGTRSSLMYESVRIIKKLMPKYVIWENVKNVLSAKHRHNFDKYLGALEELGYVNHYQVLNAKDYGVPQNRERVFVVSILGGGEFNAPETQKLSLHLNEVLEDSVDDKFYLNEKTIKTYNRSFGSKGKLITGEISPTLTAAMGGGGANVPLVMRNGFKFPEKKELKLRLKDILQDEVDEKFYLNKKWRLSTDEDEKHDVNEIAQIDGISYKATRSVTDVNKICRCLDTMGGGQREPKVLVEKVENLSETSYCIDANYHKGTSVEQFLEKKRRQLVTTNMRIRKLTPLECWRLMGFDDEDFYKAEKVNSNTQLYKQAGNSIVVNVLEAIFGELLQSETSTNPNSRD